LFLEKKNEITKIDKLRTKKIIENPLLRFIFAIIINKRKKQQQLHNNNDNSLIIHNVSKYHSDIKEHAN
jgi:hypothetical protein